jgi:hypothetical protein
MHIAGEAPDISPVSVALSEFNENKNSYIHIETVGKVWAAHISILSATEFV